MAIVERNLIQQFSTEVMTQLLRKSKIRLKLPDKADLSSSGTLTLNRPFNFNKVEGIKNV